MTPGDLAALLRVLTEYGVTEYETDDVFLKLGPRPPVVTPAPDATDGDDSDELSDQDEQVDPAFALERLYAAQLPKPRRGDE